MNETTRILNIFIKLKMNMLYTIVTILLYPFSFETQPNSQRPSPRLPSWISLGSRQGPQLAAIDSAGPRDRPEAPQGAEGAFSVRKRPGRPWRGGTAAKATRMGFGGGVLPGERGLEVEMRGKSCSREEIGALGDSLRISVSFQ